MPIVVAISSFVMHGSVGLRATQFALERRGATVISVPTVIMPWHPGLGPSTKTRPPDFCAQLEELTALAPSMDAIATGYFASAEQVQAAADFIDVVRLHNPGVLIGVDPVLGDENGRYVPDDVAAAMLDLMIPRADVITPNRFELADLSGEANLVAGARALGTAHVYVTSAGAGDGRNGAVLVTAREVVEAHHPALPYAPNGTGDLFFGITVSALISAAPPVDALVEAAAGTYQTVQRTTGNTLALAAAQDAIAHPNRSAISVRQRE